MKKIQKKGIKGITLIALVITIIVLLILAGVTIATLTGDNGILTKANDAKVNTRGAAVKEARDLWRADKKSASLTNSTETQTLDELLNSLVNAELLTEKEKQEVKNTGKVTIGNFTIEFDLPKKIDIYPSVRVISEYENGELFYKRIILYEVSVPIELLGISTQEVLEIENILIKISESDEPINISTVEKEQILNQIYIWRSKTSDTDLTIEEIIDIEAKNWEIEEKCETWQQLYNAWKKLHIENEEMTDISYDEFLYEIISEPVNLDFIQNECKQVLGANIFDREFSFQYMITKPNGSKFIENIQVNPREEYDGPWFAIEVPVDEYGEYVMTIKNLETEYEGTANIEYTDNRYFMIWNEGFYTALYDEQLKEEIDVEEAYIYYNGEKIDIKDNFLDLRDINTPYEIEVIKNGEKIKIPVLVTRFIR